MKSSKLISKLKAKLVTLTKLVQLGIKKYILQLVDLEALLEVELAKLLKPQVLTVSGFEAVVLGSSGKTYTVNLKPGLTDGQRCDCPDCVYRSRKCKHQKLVEDYLWMPINDYALSKLASTDNLEIFPSW